jgi:hypothetical protein
MRTLPFWFSVLIVVASCDGYALCQDAHDYVPNLPYTAHVVTTSFETLADGTRARREDKVIQMRDSQGRTRIEVFQDKDSNCCNHGKPDWINLYIPLRHQFIQLFPGKTASVMTYSVPVPIHGQKLGKTTTESLGGRLINGIYAEGARITQVIPPENGRGADIVYVEEEWVSPDLKIIVLSKGTNTTNPGEETTTEIRELSRSEPVPALFVIPADYKIVNLNEGPQQDSSGSPSTGQQKR